MERYRESRVLGVGGAKIKNAQRRLWGQGKGWFRSEVKDVGLAEGKGFRDSVMLRKVWVLGCRSP